MMVIDDINLSFYKLCYQAPPCFFGWEVLVDLYADVLSPSHIQFFILQATEDVVFTADLFRVCITYNQLVLHEEWCWFFSPYFLPEHHYHRRVLWGTTRGEGYWFHRRSVLFSSWIFDFVFRLFLWLYQFYFVIVTLRFLFVTQSIM